ncbi:TonB-dependent receptor [Haliea sp.]|uniref:TonB-dependent receptor n=1 Tax=Haliea sp. TaxID=1932666 RepID=UPI0035279298
MKRSCYLLTASLLAVAPALSRELTEVVVTAEWRDTPLLNQSASTTVLTSAALRERSAQHLEEVLNVIPNLNYASGASRARFFQIRGIGERSQFQEPLNASVGLMVDGIDFSGLSAIGTLFDVAQVEVLRGPQGTLHGANALAGLVNIRSAAPESSPGLRLEATVADYITQALGVVGTGPLAGDELLYRVAVQQYRSDGYYDNDFLRRDDTNERDETTVRARLRWLASATDTVDLSVTLADIDNGYDAFSLDNTRRTLSDQPGRDRQETSAASLTWAASRAALDIETVITLATSDTEYSFDEDWSFVGIAPELEYSSFDRYLRDRDSFSGELRLLSNEQSRLFEGRSDWTVGFYYLGDREDLDREYTYLDGPFNSRYDTDTSAVFGQLDTRLTDHLTLSSGLRLERRRTDYADNNGVAERVAKNLWGARLVLEYQPADGALWYGGISRGYRGNGVNAGILASAGATDDPGQQTLLASLSRFDEETLLNYEVGYKAEALQGRLQGRLALFYMDRDDQQVKGSLVLPRDDGSTAFLDYTNNAARGHNYGLELEIDWLAHEALELYVNLGLLEASFDRYINADGSDLAGRDQAHAPGYQAALGGRLAITRQLYARVDIEARDSFYFSDRHDLRSEAYELVHLRLGWAEADWDIALWARNLADRDYATRGFGSFGNDPRKGYALEPYYQFGEPRSVGLTASYQF